jgi:spermidine synthase
MSMSDGPSRLFSLASPFPAESTLRFLEPPDTSPDSLWARIFSGDYDKPFIVDIRLRRFLHFDFDAIQSAMDLSRPDRLCLSYTRKMMAFLLFNRLPRRVLLLGLGGGSLARFCYRYLPGTRLTAVELNEHVLSLRNEFHVPADDARFRVVHSDGAAYVAQLPACKDVVLADACDRSGIAPELDSSEFYRNVFRCLVPGGIFVANLCGSPDSRNAHFLRIRQVFGEQWLALPVRPDGSIIVFAFKDKGPAALAELTAAAPGLRRDFGLDFPNYLQRIVRAWQRRAEPRTLFLDPESMPS